MLFILWFIVGTFLGSFSLVVISRYGKDGFKSSLTGRSHCDKCKHKLEFFDLVPIVSFVSTLGKCRYCHKPIKNTHLIYEVSFGLLGLILAWKFNLPVVIGLNLIILTGLAIVAGIDWSSQEIIEPILIGLIVPVIGLIYYSHLDINSAIIGLLVASLGFLVLVVAGRGQWMGLGDVEVVALLGLWLGWPNVLVAIMTAFVTGAVYGIYLIYRKKAKAKERIAFGPFLVLGGLVALIFGKIVLQWYLGGF